MVEFDLEDEYLVSVRGYTEREIDELRLVLISYRRRRNRTIRSAL